MTDQPEPTPEEVEHEIAALEEAEDVDVKTDEVPVDEPEEE